MSDDPKRIVADGYDTIAPRYLAWSGLQPSPQRMRYLGRLLDLVPPGASVLELGCGAGVPVSRALAARCRLTGVDISAAQIALARQHVPTATFVQADMTALDVAPATFDAVTAFYAITHVPRDQHAELLARIAAWLRPGGLLLATMGASDSPDTVEADWLGAPMFFSHFDAETNRALVRQAGLDLLDAEVVDEHEDGVTVPFLWVVARKPTAGSGG
ncbi:class I SAM-dependent methyltransferase [Sorangium sp. So ce185]|uniref:class I SAM-dependent methyltransferase n=1 Tax=Sorangium sp. So ce185 TaxID=3133287 RepID=UPI003F60E8E5